jgi:hypothetical protein
MQLCIYFPGYAFAVNSSIHTLHRNEFAAAIYVCLQHIKNNLWNRNEKKLKPFGIHPFIHFVQCN